MVAEVGVEKRRLGRRGPDVSVVGIGTWAMGGSWRMGWGEQHDEDSLEALESAIDGGVNWIDTAPVYGLGRAERMLKPVLARHPGVLVFSKVGFVDDHSVDLSPSSIRTQVEASLERLGRDRIDLYQVHWPDESVPIEKSWAELSRLRDEGIVGALGLSNHAIEQVWRANEIAPVDALQVRYSLLDRRCEEDLLPWCAENGVGFLAYSPLASGLLGGRFDPEALAPDDWRRTDERFAQELAASRPVLDELERSRSHGAPASLAIAWALSNSTVSAAIAGVRSVADVPGVLAGAERLDPVLSHQLSVVSAAQGRTARAGRR